MTAIESGALRPERIRSFSEDPILRDKPIEQWDASALLKLM